MKMADCQNFARPERIRQVVGEHARNVHRVSIADLNSLFAFLNQLHGWLNANSSVRLLTAPLDGPALLKRWCPGFINPHQLFNVSPPVILNTRSETAPLGPREADSYSGWRDTWRDLHRHDPNGDKNDQPRRIDCQVRGWWWERGDGSRPRYVHPVATSFTRRAHSCDSRRCLAAAFSVLPAHFVPGP